MLRASQKIVSGCRAYSWRANMTAALQGRTIMKMLCERVVIAAALALLATTGAQAQQNQPAPTPVVEIYPCTYRGDNDIDNLHTVTTRFNTWADRNKDISYTAFLATPYAYSADLEADVLWLGAWPNGAAMGVSEARYQTQGGDISTAFDAVVDCNAHSLYAEVVINQPATPPPQNGVATFEDCKVHEGRTDEEAIAALRQWAEYTKSRGSDAFSAILFPLAGLPNNADYTFKRVTSFDSMEAFGKFTDIY